MVFLVWLVLHLTTLLAQVWLVPARVHLSYEGKWPLADRLPVLLWYAAPLSWLIQRPAADASVFWLGLLLYISSAALVIWAMRANPCFAPHIERPAHLAVSGPYAVLNHPGYVGFAGMGLGSCLLLNHWRGCAPLIFYIAILCYRAGREDQLLRGTNV